MKREYLNVSEEDLTDEKVSKLEDEGYYSLYKQSGRNGVFYCFARLVDDKQDNFSRESDSEDLSRSEYQEP